MLPRFHVRTIAPAKTESMLVSGSFSRPEQISVDDSGWLFVSETESTIADVVSVDSIDAGLDVPKWSMTRHVHEGAVLPWLDCRWQARDLAFLLDAARQWRRVRYEATDAVVFATRTLKCAQCGWTGSIEAELTRCPKCASELTTTEIFGNQEAAFPLGADARFVETRSRFWDHDHCLICDVAIGRAVAFGYRESSFAGGPNSVGIWLCEACYERYLNRGDFSFLVRGRVDQ
ncbi:MAG TPA: hypothetical protein VH740_27745 [Vicinamibacterales bacterium]